MKTKAMCYEVWNGKIVGSWEIDEIMESLQQSWPVLLWTSCFKERKTNYFIKHTVDVSVTCR